MSGDIRHGNLSVNFQLLLFIMYHANNASMSHLKLDLDFVLDRIQCGVEVVKDEV